MAVDPNVTPLIIGTFFGNILLGINFLQAFQYFRRFPLDRALFKGLVAWVGFLIMLNECFVLYATSQASLVKGFLGSAPWSLTMRPVLTAMIALSVQVFFARVVWRLSLQDERKRFRIFILSVIGVFMVTGFVFGALTTSIGFRFGFSLDHLDLLLGSAGVWIICSVLADITISVSINFYLQSDPTETTRDPFAIMRRNLFLNNALTTVVSAIDMIVFLVLPKTSWYVIALSLINSLYYSSLLVSLNARSELRFEQEEGMKRDNEALRAATTMMSQFDADLVLVQSTRRASTLSKLGRSRTTSTAP